MEPQQSQQLLVSTEVDMNDPNTPLEDQVRVLKEYVAFIMQTLQHYNLITAQHIKSE